MDNKKLFYIYMYQNGKNKGNVGFAEVKNISEECKLKVTIKIPRGYMGETVAIYLYQLKDDKVVKFKIGEVDTLKDTCRFKKVIDNRYLKEKGISIDEIAGIYIFSKEYDNWVFKTDIKKTKRFKICAS